MPEGPVHYELLVLLWQSVRHELGAGALVRADQFLYPDGKEPRLRLWDLFDGDLVERDLSDLEARRCDALGFYWCIVEDPKLHSTLRLARDKEGRDLLLTRAEAERAEKDAALARIAELEAELARKR